MRRLWLDHVRRRRPVPTGDVEDQAEEVPGPPADQPDTADLWARVCRLPEAQRLALGLRVHAEASYDEIAEALGTTRKAVEMLLRRARRTLAGGDSGG